MPKVRAAMVNFAMMNGTANPNTVHRVRRTSEPPVTAGRAAQIERRSQPSTPQVALNAAWRDVDDGRFLAAGPGDQPTGQLETFMWGDVR